MCVCVCVCVCACLCMYTHLCRLGCYYTYSLFCFCFWSELCWMIPATPKITRDWVAGGKQYIYNINKQYTAITRIILLHGGQQCELFEQFTTGTGRVQSLYKTVFYIPLFVEVVHPVTIFNSCSTWTTTFCLQGLTQSDWLCCISVCLNHDIAANIWDF